MSLIKEWRLQVHQSIYDKEDIMKNQKIYNEKPDLVSEINNDEENDHENDHNEEENEKDSMQNIDGENLGEEMWMLLGIKF